MDIKYKFLDEYVGDTFAMVKHSRVNNTYHFISNNGVLVLTFNVRQFSFMVVPQIKLFRNDTLCGTVGRFFDLSSEESMMVVRDWFGNKLGLKKVSDLLSLIYDEMEYV